MPSTTASAARSDNAPDTCAGIAAHFTLYTDWCRREYVWRRDEAQTLMGNLESERIGPARDASIEIEFSIAGDTDIIV